MRGDTHIIDPDADPNCVRCGRPMSPHDWSIGLQVCPFCEELERVFDEQMREALAEEELRSRER